MKHILLTLITVILLSSIGWAQSTRQDTLKDLSRKIELLTKALEKKKLGKVAERKYESKFGLGPAASQVYHKEKQGVSIAGYGEIVYENYAAKKEDDNDGGKTDKIDYLRNIIYVGYKFSDRLYFNSEIEFEHALAGDGKPGEVAMELGYIDAVIRPELIVRAGMVLVPVGIINEYHEPSTFYGSLRPETERQVIPSTWRTTGLGLTGNFDAGIGYRLYIVEGLNARKFSASGIRSGRQGGAKAIAENFGITGRMDFTALPGLNVGGSFYLGNSAQGLTDSTGADVDVATSLFSAHGIFTQKGLELRALFAKGTVDNVAKLNAANGLADAKSIGESQSGFYVTAAYDVLGLLREGSTAMLQPFVQYEKLNTQESVPDGFSIDKSKKRTNITVGLMFKPHPNVGFKLDYIQRANEAKTGLNQLNAAVTYLF